MADAVVIVSGGMDSVTLLHHLVKTKRLDPAVITFRYGQKHGREVECAEGNAVELGCENHLVMDLSVLRPLFSKSALVDPDVEIPDALDVQGDPQPATYVPNRNMIFLALAAAYAESRGIRDIHYGAQRHDRYGYWDTTPQFLESLNRIYSLNPKTAVRIHAGFVDLSKTEILKLGLGLGVDYGKTWSCYEGGSVACGRCPTCAERLKAFEEIGVEDPLPYGVE